MQLYFGPNLRYFFHDGKGNFRYRAPPDFLQFLKSTQVTTICCVAFGEGDSYYVSYTTTNGQNFARADLNDHYPKLHSWLYLENLPHDYATIAVSLGPDGAFFAAGNQGQRWRNIPEDAVDYYQKFTRPDLYLTKRVHSLDLGYKGTFSGIGMDSVYSPEYTLTSCKPETLADGYIRHY